MRATLGPPPQPVFRQVTVVMTEEEAQCLRRFLGRQAIRHYIAAFKDAAPTVPSDNFDTTPGRMQQVGDALFDALHLALSPELV